MNNRIGLMDSGVGALTVAKEFQDMLPNESIYLLGDSGNVPYGNKTEEEIHRLAKTMMDFLIEEKDVKLIAVACNTISTLVDKYFSDYDIPVISIIDPIAKYVADNGIKEVGVMGTVFTIDSKEYDKKIEAYAGNDVKIISEASLELASIIDSGEFDEEEIRIIIKRHLDNIRARSTKLEHIILGCTHYPIVGHIFEELAPDINFIDPAKEQVRYIEELLYEKNIKNINTDSKFDLYTTGDKDIYNKIIKLVGLKSPDNIYILDKNIRCDK